MRKLTAHIDARGTGQLAVDDADLSPAVGSIYITAHVGHPPTVMITLPTADLDLELDTPRVTIPEPVAAALINLGWTPPPIDDRSPVAASRAHEDQDDDETDSEATA